MCDRKPSNQERPSVPKDVGVPPFVWCRSNAAPLRYTLATFNEVQHGCALRQANNGLVAVSGVFTQLWASHGPVNSPVRFGGRRAPLHVRSLDHVT